MNPILAFDIECVPDFDGIRKVHDLPRDLPDRLVAEWYAQKRRSTSGNEFPPHYLQRVVAIACALRNETGFRVWSIGEADDPEPELIRRFFEGIEKLTPQLVSWNGGGFDLPVLQHRALICGACAVALRISREVRNATIVFVVCDRGDRYLSTGVFA